MPFRRCSKTGCSTAAVATLTYVYADSTAVVGSLAPEHIPGSYDLCREHCEQLSAPRGWEVVRLPIGEPEPPADDDDDLLALANAVREVGLMPEEREPSLASDDEPWPTTPVSAEQPATRHLRVVADDERPQP